MNTRNLFNQIQVRKPKKNKFDLSHEKKLSFNMGELIPIYTQEILPGDTFRSQQEIFLRLAPMLAPVMHRVNVFTHTFFVPTRLIWNEWEDFITGGREGTSAPVHPYITIDDTRIGWLQKGFLADYLGLPTFPNPTTVGNEINISALPFRAYQLIWQEYYRDQNLTAEIPETVLKDSGDQTGSAPELCTLKRRAWEKDYFTSALPWAQRGPEILMPMSPEVTYKTVSSVYNADGTVPTGDQLLGNGPSPGGSASLFVNKTGTGANGNTGRIENIESIDNASTTINDLRRAVRLQEWLEKNARGGARYIEQILHHFGIVSSDARLQRPEYLGGGKQPVVISEVLSTVAAEDPQGNMAGHGVSAGSNNGFQRTFEEHGFLMTIMSVLPRTAYQQGINKMWTRFDKFDYFWPELANIGEQEVHKQELMYNPAAAPAEPTFGYQSRYAEYKYMPSTVHGDFRDNLDFWHMGRILGPDGDDEINPDLTENFVTAYPTTRIFAVTDPQVHHLYCQVYNKVDALRPMPYFGTPTL